MRGRPTAREVPPGRWHFRAGVIGLFVVSLFGSLVLWTIIPMVAMGWRPVVVGSGSMAPALRTGDIMLVSGADPDGVGEGTVVFATDPSRDGTFTHRVVAIDPDGMLVTRGDANARPDSTPLDPTAVRGVGQMVTPMVGLPVVWASDGAWLKLAAAIAFLGAAVGSARWAFSPPIRLWGKRGRLRAWGSPQGRSSARMPRRQLGPIG